MRPDWSWCEWGPGQGNQPADSIRQAVLDFNYACPGMDITELQKVNIYLPVGTFRIDDIRAE